MKKMTRKTGLKIWKKVTAFVLLASVLLTMTGMETIVQAATESSGAEILYSGKSGDLDWSIDANGLLTVSGSGDYERDYEVTEYNVKAPSWYEYRSSIKSAIIDVDNITDTSYMFYGCSSMQSLDMSELDTSKVTDMNNMFAVCVKLQSIDLSNFDTSKVTDMNGMFYGCSSLQSLDLSNFDTSKVTNMFYMFWRCNSLQSLDLSSFDTSEVTDMFCMFQDCENLQSLDLSSFDTSKVTDMGGMFEACKKLQSLELSSFDTSNVTNMEEMFDSCESLESLNVSKFETNNVTSMCDMFGYCYNLESLDVSNFDMSNVTETSMMFFKCSKLNSVILPYNLTSMVDFYSSGIKKIYIPTTVSKISSGAFLGCSDYTFYGYTGSYAQTYANENSIPFVPLDGVEEIRLSETSQTMTAGETVSLQATVLPDTVENKALAWTSSDKSVAKVDKNGLITAVSAGEATITATSLDGSGAYAVCAVTVNEATIRVTEVTVSPAAYTLFSGENLQLQATVKPTDATTKDIAWTSDNDSVATVDSTGLVTAKKAGEATITAASTDGSKVSATCVIKVQDRKVQNIILSQTSQSVVSGSSLQLLATVTPDTAADKTLKWTSSDESVATIEIKDNTTCIVTAVGTGNTTITATSTDGSNVSASCVVTVQNVPSSENTDQKPDQKPSSSGDTGSDSGSSSSSGSSTDSGSSSGSGSSTSSGSSSSSGSSTSSGSSSSSGSSTSSSSSTSSGGGTATNTNTSTNTNPNPSTTIALSYYIATFDANSGRKLSRKTTTLQMDDSLGILPKVQKSGYRLKGWYTLPSGGEKVTKASVLNASMTLYAQWKKVSVGKVSSLKAKASGSNKIKVNWKKTVNADGYVVEYSANKNFKSSVTKKKTSTVSAAVLKSLKKGKTYYVRVRAYKLDSAGKRVYGKYSAVKRKTL